MSVNATFSNGVMKNGKNRERRRMNIVNVSMDSGTAMIRDIINNLGT